MYSITYPFDSNEILRRKKALKRHFLEKKSLMIKRIAIICGSTIGDIKDILEIFLLNFGIRPQFYIGQYNRFYEDIMFDNKEIKGFEPELILIHTSMRNLSDGEMLDKLQEVWAKIKADFSCPIIQNNFELPIWSLESGYGLINSLNIKLADYANQNSDFYINNIQHLSACFGLGDWFNEQDYFLYKYAFSVSAIPIFSYNIAKIIKSIYGKNKKCLVLDLDNTIWGGVVGEVGATGIEIGAETALGEAFISFQKYIKLLHGKGVILAVCSKNDEAIAKEAFSNPNMHLRLDDIAVFCANWDSKADNILKIAKQLNILTDSMVFIDDNPAERELVRQSLPDVEVPEVNSPIEFIRFIEEAGYFYSAGVSEDDKKRNDYYVADAKRNASKVSFVDYGEYLQSLEMSSEIRPFTSEYLERITQLINKTNQFNLTTKRYNKSEIEKIALDSNFTTLFATLDDKFGSNGIVSVLIGEIVDDSLHIRLWVMSCRVFKRDLELAVFDRIVEIARKKKLKEVTGYYYKTEKNKYVANLFDGLGFIKTTEGVWRLDLTNDYQYKNKFIKVKGESE